MFRKIFTAKNNSVDIILPDEYLNKRLELIIFPLEESHKKEAKTWIPLIAKKIIELFIKNYSFGN